MKQIVKLTPFKDFAIIVSYVQRSLLAIVLSIETANLQYYTNTLLLHESQTIKRSSFSLQQLTLQLTLPRKKKGKTEVKLRDDDKFQQSLLLSCNLCSALKCFTRYASANKN